MAIGFNFQQLIFSRSRQEKYFKNCVKNRNFALRSDWKEVFLVFSVRKAKSDFCNRQSQWSLDNMKPTQLARPLGPKKPSHLAKNLAVLSIKRPELQRCNVLPSHTPRSRQSMGEDFRIWCRLNIGDVQCNFVSSRVLPCKNPGLFLVTSLDNPSVRFQA